jgi:hypothetical protein
VGYATAWENSANINAQTAGGMPPTPHAIGNSSVNPATGTFGQAIATGKLAPNTAGWMCFTPKSVSSTVLGTNQMGLTEAPQLNGLNSVAPAFPSVLFPSTGGPMCINTPSSTAFLVAYAPNVPIVAQRDASGVFKLTQNNVPITTISNYYFGRWKPSFLVRRTDSGFHSILSNFPCPTSTGQYAHLKYELDGYYHVMSTCNVTFVYNEEYNSSALTFNIYTSDMIKQFDQSNFPTVPVALGENRISLFVGDDAHCLGTGQYILEVINAKKEHFYLRFYNSCTTCAIHGGH